MSFSRADLMLCFACAVPVRQLIVLIEPIDSEEFTGTSVSRPVFPHLETRMAHRLLIVQRNVAVGALEPPDIGSSLDFRHIAFDAYPPSSNEKNI